MTPHPRNGFVLGVESLLHKPLGQPVAERFHGDLTPYQGQLGFCSVEDIQPTSDSPVFLKISLRRKEPTLQLRVPWLIRTTQGVVGYPYQCDSYRIRVKAVGYLE